MQLQQISHNEDIKRLIQGGYDISLDGNYIVASNIPYLNSQKEIMYGKLICALALPTPTTVGVPPDHTIYFVGDLPYNSDGTPVNVVNHSNPTKLTTAVTANHYFSSKPPSGKYANYYDKIHTYSQILVTQAQVLNPLITATPNKQQF